MSATDILRSLPASLDWMVLFRLSAIRRWAQDAYMKAMFFLPEQIDLGPFSYVVRTSPGRYLVPQDGSNLPLATNAPMQQI